MAQQQGLLTITGYVGGQPTQFNREGMPHASSFRLASTRHYFDGRTQQWKDLPTTWITVKAYRGLSESICQSFKKGEPVIVTGVLATESWVDQNGKQQSKLVMEANAAGHDLSYGVSTFRKLAKKNDSGQQDAQPGQALGRDPYVQAAQQRGETSVNAMGGQSSGVDEQGGSQAGADSNAAEPLREEFGGDGF